MPRASPSSLARRLHISCSRFWMQRDVRVTMLITVVRRGCNSGSDRDRLTRLTELAADAASEVHDVSDSLLSR
jgi:hypothetical protein